MKLAQHIIAAVSALLLLLGSFFQSRRSVARAKEKVAGKDPDLEAYLRRWRWWHRWLPGKILPASNSNEVSQDARHLIVVARLWELIIVGSVIALGAEVFDLLIDLSAAHENCPVSGLGF